MLAKNVSSAGLLAISVVVKVTALGEPLFWKV